MRMLMLNDQPYIDGQEDPHESLDTTLAFSVDDWGATRAMSWVWGIVCGWDDDAMAEQAAKHGWDEATTARLNRLHERFEAMSAVATPDPAEPGLGAAFDRAVLSGRLDGFDAGTVRRLRAALSDTTEQQP
jgi:hypothetical protein